MSRFLLISMFCLQVNSPAFQASFTVDDGICETKICKNLQKEVSLMKLDRDNLKAEIVWLKEEIDHCYKNEFFKAFEAKFL